MSETRIIIRLTEEDSAWIKAQSEALGLDNEAAVVRMLVRQARLGNVSLNVVMQGISTSAPEPRTATDVPARRGGRPSGNVSVGDAYNPEAIPVAPDVVEDLLASRLQELGVDPAVVEVSANNVVQLSQPDYSAPADPNTPAMSLRPAPVRQGRDYR